VATNSDSTVEPRIAVTRVSKRLGDIHALCQVSFSVLPGETVVLIGGNGSGKTTVLDMLSGVVVPDCGEVRIDGIRAIHRVPQWFARRGVLRTFQSPRVFEQMTIRECLDMGTWTSSIPGVVSATVWPGAYRNQASVASRRSADLLTRLGWSSIATQKAGELSYGQRKLLALAQLALTPGSFALCDEPLAGLDADKSALGIQLLETWKREGPTRVLLIATHDLDSWPGDATCQYQLENGVLERLQ